jgi:hypothetical protein
MGRSWELSLPQLASLIAAIVLCVSLVTVVGVRRWGTPLPSMSQGSISNSTPVTDRVFQRQQLISYWNQRVELNKARNPHDEISEQMLNESLNDKLALLKEFSDL